MDVFVSAEEKKRRYLHLRALKQRRYGRLIEASDSLTSLFPQLISKLIAKKIKASNLSSSDAAALVQSTY